MKIYFIWVGWEKLYKLNYNIPPLGILRVAGETPPGIPVSFTDETVSPIDFDSDADIVALSFLTRPYRSPCGRTSTLAAKRWPPIWLDCHTAPASAAWVT